MKKPVQTNTNNTDKIIIAGATVAALAATGYLLFGPNGEKNRRKVGDWTAKMMDELTDKLKQAKELTKPMYEAIVDEVAKEYGSREGVSKQELQSVVADIKKHWKDITKAA